MRARDRSSGRRWATLGAFLLAGTLAAAGAALADEVPAPVGAKAPRKAERRDGHDHRAPPRRSRPAPDDGLESVCTAGPECTTDCTVSDGCHEGLVTESATCTAGTTCTDESPCLTWTPGCTNACTAGPDCDSVPTKQANCGETSGPDCSNTPECTAGPECTNNSTDCTEATVCTASPNCSTACTVSGPDCSPCDMTACPYHCTGSTFCTSIPFCWTIATWCGDAGSASPLPTDPAEPGRSGGGWWLGLGSLGAVVLVAAGRRVRA